jgi:hypothetical protein
MTRALGWIYAALGALGLLGGLWMLLTLARDASPLGQATFGWMTALVIPFALLILLPALIGGIGLALSRPWGKVPAMIASAVLLLLFPLGTVLGGVGLWVLITDRPEPPHST